MDGNKDKQKQERRCTSLGASTKLGSKGQTGSAGTVRQNDVKSAIDLREGPDMQVQVTVIQCCRT